MKNDERKTKIGSLLTLLLFAVFAVCVLAVLLTGADAYRHIVRRGQSGYDGRTAAQYLTTRVRQADTSEGIRTESFDGLDTLVLTEEIDGQRYETRIYCHDGYLRELFAAADSGLAPEDGEKVLPLESLMLSFSDGELQAELTENGRTQRLLLSQRSGEEVSS